MRVWKGMEMSRAWADNSNDVSQLSISHPKGTLSLLTLLLTGEVMITLYLTLFFPSGNEVEWH